MASIVRSYSLRLSPFPLRCSSSRAEHDPDKSANARHISAETPTTQARLCNHITVASSILMASFPRGDDGNADTRSMMRPTLLPLSFVLLLAPIACSRGSSKRAPTAEASPSVRVQEQPRPSGVPDSAQLVRSDLAVGSPSAAQGGAAAGLHIFYSLRCANDLLTIATTHETVYAQLPCDRSPPDGAVHPFLAKPVRLRIVAGNPSKLFVESDTGGTIEFTVPVVWIDAR